MGRPRKWRDDAERKRHERGASQPVSVAGDVAPATSPRGPAEGLVLDPGEEDGPQVGARISEADYVAAEVAQTRLAIERGLKDHDGHRVDRARAYARSRYAGFLAGEVASL